MYSDKQKRKIKTNNNIYNNNKFHEYFEIASEFFLVCFIFNIATIKMHSFQYIILISIFN